MDEAIEHTPTLLELYSWKAKIFKYQNEFDKSLELHEKARNMDLGDRYLCNKSVKAYLRCVRITEAEQVMSLFSKDDTEGEKMNIHLVQCLWYELALSRAYFKAGDFL